MSRSLVGGTAYDSSQGQTWDVPDNNSDHPGYAWFCPLDVLAGLVGVNSELYKFWCNLCSYSSYCECVLLDTSAFTTQNPPTYPCLNSPSLVGIDMCEVFYEWMFSSFWAQITGLQEADCSGPTSGPGPPPPPSPPPGGG